MEKVCRVPWPAPVCGGTSCSYEQGPLSLLKGPGSDDTLHDCGHRPISQPSFHPVFWANISVLIIFPSCLAGHYRLGICSETLTQQLHFPPNPSLSLTPLPGVRVTSVSFLTVSDLWRQVTKRLAHNLGKPRSESHSPTSSCLTSGYYKLL